MENPEIKKRKTYSFEKLRAALAIAKKGEENLFQLSRKFEVPYNTLRYQFANDSSVPVEAEQLDAKELAEDIEKIKLNLCCACLVEDSSVISDSQTLSNFGNLLGSVNPNLTLKFCSTCSECLEGFSKFKTTCLESIDFLNRINEASLADIKFEESSNDVKFEVDAVKEDDFLEPDFVNTDDDYNESGEKVVEVKKRRSNRKSSQATKKVVTKRTKDKLRYCGICKKYFKNVILPHVFDVHIKEVDDGKFHCLICDTVLYQKSTLRFHFESHNTMEKPLQCKICDESFVQKRAYAKHLQKHQKYECDLCQRTLSTKSRLKEHILTQHTSAKKCSYCSEVFYNDEEYAEHQKMERARRDKARDTIRRVCDICGFNASCGPALSAHKERKHPSGEVVCDICGKTCINRHQYKWHIREYHQEKRFSCNYCNKKFSQKAGLNKHIKVMHERSSSVSCDICGNVFTLLYSLKKHKDTVHSNVYKFECKICGRGFKVASLLKKHQFSHLNKKPFNCHLCTTGYYMIDYLKSHYLKIHDLNYTSQDVKDVCIRINIDKELL